MGLFFTALGLMMILEGIPFFCFPDKIKQFAKSLPEIPDGTLRSLGFIMMVVGLIVVYFGRETV